MLFYIHKETKDIRAFPEAVHLAVPLTPLGICPCHLGPKEVTIYGDMPSTQGFHCMC